VNAEQLPSSYRLMKSEFGDRYMLMGSGEEVRKPEKIKHPIRTALRGVRKGMMALILLLVATSPGGGQETCEAEGERKHGTRTGPAECGCNHPCGGPADSRVVPLWWLLGLTAIIVALVVTPKSLMARAWSVLYYLILSPIRWASSRCREYENSEDWATQPRPTEAARGVTFEEWPPALQRARLKHEAHCRAFFADNKLGKAAYMQEIQAGTRPHPDGEKEENIPFWELWTPEEKEAQRERERLRNSWRSGKPAVTPREDEEAELRRHSYLY
jgi:hypothetical protein